MKTIDARGVACPEPLVMTRNAIQSGDSSYKILVDSANAKENVSRFAENSGFSVAVSESDDAFEIVITKK